MLTGWATASTKKGLPRLLGAQASGATPIVLGRAVKNPDTIASAIRIGNPARWAEAVKALEESKGLIVAVNDRRIMGSWRMLAELEGLFVEAATAAGLAPLIQEIELETTNPVSKKIVVVPTGHGLKDPSTAILQAVDPIELPASLGAVEAQLDS